MGGEGFEDGCRVQAFSPNPPSPPLSEVAAKNQQSLSQNYDVGKKWLKVVSHSSSLWPLLPLPRNPSASYEHHSFTAISLELDLKPSRCQQYCKTPSPKNRAHFRKLLVMLAGHDRKCYPVCLDGCALGAIKSYGVLWYSLSLMVDC